MRFLLWLGNGIGNEDEIAWEKLSFPGLKRQLEIEETKNWLPKEKRQRKLAASFPMVLEFIDGCITPTVEADSA